MTDSAPKPLPLQELKRPPSGEQAAKILLDDLENTVAELSKLHPRDLMAAYRVARNPDGRLGIDGPMSRIGNAQARLESLLNALGDQIAASYPKLRRRS